MRHTPGVTFVNVNKPMPSTIPLITLITRTMEQIVNTLRYFRAYFPDTEAGQLMWAVFLITAISLSVCLFIGLMWLAVKLVWVLLWAGLWLLMICLLTKGPAKRSRRECI